MGGGGYGGGGGGYMSGGGFPSPGVEQSPAVEGKKVHKLSLCVCVCVECHYLVVFFSISAVQEPGYTTGNVTPNTGS